MASRKALGTSALGDRAPKMIIIIISDPNKNTEPRAKTG